MSEKIINIMHFLVCPNVYILLFLSGKHKPYFDCNKTTGSLFMVQTSLSRTLSWDIKEHRGHFLKDRNDLDVISEYIILTLTVTYSFITDVI